MRVINSNNIHVPIHQNLGFYYYNSVLLSLGARRWLKRALKQQLQFSGDN